MHICIYYYFLTSINRCYAQTYDDRDECYYSPANLFQYSLPLFIFLQMMVSMVLFVQFQWKRGIHTVSLQQSTTVILSKYITMYNTFRT